MKKYLKSVLAVSLATLAVPAFAVPPSQCAVGTTCNLPAHVAVNAATGTSYRCVIDSQGTKPKVWVHYAGNFKGVSKVHHYTPQNEYIISGRYTNTTNQAGEIRFRNFFGKGTVTCFVNVNPLPTTP